MAITTLPPDERTSTLTLVPEISTPKVERKRKPAPAQRGAKVFLRILPDLTDPTTSRISSQGFFLLMSVLVIGASLALLALNTMMTSDAFILERLKIATNSANDQRDAILKLAESKASPDQLADAAHRLGMVPAEKIFYLDVNSLRANPEVLGAAK